MLTALAVISVIGCNRKTGMKTQLAEADRIIDTAPDSALAILEGINIDAGDDGDKAMYNLLLTQARYANYIPVTSDSLINISIRHYKQTGDTHLLARAYYYKGATTYDNGETENALTCLNEAERLAEAGNDKQLSSKIYEKKCFVFYELGYNEEQLKYAKRFYNITTELKDTDRMGTALNELAVAYQKAGQKDSACACLKTSIKHIARNDNRTKAISYANIAQMYIDNEEYDSAQHYIDKATGTYRLPFALSVAGELLYKTGQTDSAATLWRKVAKDGDVEDKISAYRLLKKYYEAKQMYKEAALATDSLNSLEDSLNRHNYRIAEMQTEFYNDQEDRREAQRTALAISSICAAAAACCLIFAYKYRKSRSKSAHTITSMSDEIEKDKQEQAKKDTEIKHIKAEFERYKENNEKDLYARNVLMQQGHKIFCKIQRRETNIAKLTNEDIDAFIKFYHEMNDRTPTGFTYNKRRRKQELFSIIQSMGYDTKEAADFMCTTTEAVRKMRSRINHENK